MSHRKKVGDLYAIPLLNHSFAFGRVLQEVSVAFYKQRGKSIEDLPLDEEYEFTVSVYKSCFREWIFVENRPFTSPEESQPPCYQMRDIFIGKYRIYSHGEIIDATEEECSRLEVCAIWENEHIVDRLLGKEWKKWFPRFYHQ